MRINQKVQLLYERILVGKVDLHMHSTASDGTTSPADLAEAVCAAGLLTVALTDHDTLAGIQPMRARLSELAATGIAVPRFIPGVEVSVTNFGRELHLLAYYPDSDEKRLQPYLDAQQQSRFLRNVKLCSKLQSLGYEIDPREMTALARGRNAGRPHAARILVRKGYFHSVREAFERLLADGREGYVPRYNPSAADALKEIRKTGGVSVLAHPANYGWLEHPEDLTAHLRVLQEMGLEGVEVIHGETSLRDSRIIADSADALGLLKTVGSDYHGENKTDVRLFTESDDFASFTE